MGWMSAVGRGQGSEPPETMLATGTCSLETEVTLLSAGSTSTVTIPDAGDERIGMRKVFVSTNGTAYQITPSSTLDAGTSDEVTMSGSGGVAEFIWTGSGWVLLGDQDVAVPDT